MAIGNIQFVYDHISFCSRAFRPEKNNRKRPQRNFNWNLQENAVEALKPSFAPHNMFNRAFRKRQNVAWRGLISENR